MLTTIPQKRVLVVEDDPTYLHLWKRIIDALGVKKFWAVGRPEAAARLLKQERADLLISDVLLPKMTGYDLAKLARTRNPSIEILLTTGYQTDLSHFDLGGLRCHLLHKPYQNIQDVSLFLQRLLGGEDVRSDADEDSFSDNEDFPEITEWTL